MLDQSVEEENQQKTPVYRRGGFDCTYVELRLLRNRGKYYGMLLKTLNYCVGNGKKTELRPTKITLLVNTYK